MIGAGAGAGGDRSGADSGSGETTGSKGEGALLTVVGATSDVSLMSDSLVISMTSSGRGGAGGRTRV